MILLAHVAVAAAATAPCPFPAGPSTGIAATRSLPPDTAQLIGDMADHGEPFQATDVLSRRYKASIYRYIAVQKSAERT